MVGIPAWVSEGSIRKYHRAVAALRVSGQEASEEAVKALYIKYQGLVLDEPIEYVEEEVVEKKVKKTK